ncbi:MAG: hypothetical protein KDD50_03200 [Bdellovibrionales bacterium]|nr:hypothetical protein [Bdellovibrionales bacterium]
MSTTSSLFLKFLFVMLILTHKCLVLASPEFFCWVSEEFPTVALGAELSIKDCNDKVQTTGNISREGEKDILCMHTVLCAPLTADLNKYLKEKTGKHIRELSDTELKTEVKNKFAYVSTLSCHGKVYTVDGARFPSCPEPNECKDEILYGVGPASTQPTKKIMFKVKMNDNGGEN